MNRKSLHIILWRVGVDNLAYVPFNELVKHVFLEKLKIKVRCKMFTVIGKQTAYMAVCYDIYFSVKLMMILNLIPW